MVLKLPPDDTIYWTAVIEVARAIKVKAETGSPVMVKKSGSGLITIKSRSDHKKMNRLLPAQRIEEAQQHRAFLIIVTNFSEKPLLLHKHTISVVGTKPPKCCYYAA